MRRAVPLVAAGASLVLLAGLGIVGLQGADTSRAYEEQSAVDAFRSAAASPSAGSAVAGSPPPARAEPGGTASAAARPVAPAPAPAPVPSGGAADAAPGDRPGSAAPTRRAVEPGVYRYATQGHEQVDALGGSRHDYPSTSTVTYSRTGCGTQERWQPLEGRVSTTLSCAGASGPELRSTFQQREFFGQSQSESYRCEPGLLVRAWDPRPGQSWTGRCHSDDSTVTVVSRVVALEELQVDGVTVPVVRLTIRGTASGSVRGRSDRELWLARADGLLVQATGDTDTEADTAAGRVRYQERYELRLLSLTPRR